MEFREFYGDICAIIRFDYHTRTYIGELDGLADSSFVQAGSYEEIRTSLKQAVEDHLAGRTANTEEEWLRVSQSEEARAKREAEERERDNLAADAAFHNRQYLRFQRRR